MLSHSGTAAETQCPCACARFSRVSNKISISFLPVRYPFKPIFKRLQSSTVPPSLPLRGSRTGPSHPSRPLISPAPTRPRPESPAATPPRALPSSCTSPATRARFPLHTTRLAPSHPQIHPPAHTAASSSDPPAASPPHRTASPTPSPTHRPRDAVPHHPTRADTHTASSATDTQTPAPPPAYSASSSCASAPPKAHPPPHSLPSLPRSFRNT